MTHIDIFVVIKWYSYYHAESLFTVFISYIMWIKIVVWHDDGHSLCGCVDPFVCFGAKHTQTACTQNLHRDRKKAKEWRSERRQKGTVSRREQKRSVGLREQSREGEGHSQQKPAWLVAFEGVLPWVHARVSSQNAQKVSWNSLSCAWGWPKSVFVRLFFSSTLSVVFCVSVKKCVMPVVGDEINH